VADVTLEHRLVAMGAGLTFRGEDRLADDVVAALRRPAAVAGWRRPLLVAAAIVLAVAVVLAAVPGTRHAVARLLGLEHLPIRIGVVLPPTGDVELGPPRTLAEATALAGVDPYVVPALGTPLAVYAPGGAYVVVRYDDHGTQVLVTTLQGTVDEVAFSKLVASGVQVRPVDVTGHDGWWITGEPHVFMYRDRHSDFHEARPAADTLAWQVGDTVVRIEADIPLARAEQLAAAARPV
jgi:hypothetical protein